MNKPPVDVVDRHTTKVGSQVQAYVYAELPSGRSVSYCAHHGTKYWDALNAQASVVIDLRDTVLATGEEL
jgi:hypothetical protein